MGTKDYGEKKQRPRNADDAARSAGASTAQHLALSAAGAAGSALLGAILARRGFARKTVSGALAALGAGIAGVGGNEALRALGAGAMSGSGAQLVLMLFAEYAEHGHSNDPPAPTTATIDATAEPITAGENSSAPAHAPTAGIGALADLEAA